MSRIRKIEIKNFRCIQAFEWAPSAGVNCLVGPGDTGKSTLLDAIELCLGARRNLTFADTDFYKLDVETPIMISLTLGALDDTLKNLDTYVALPARLERRNGRDPAGTRGRSGDGAHPADDGSGRP